MREIRNARIKATSLGVEDHGLFTAVVQLEGEGWGQGFGCFNFGSFTEGPTPEQARNLGRFILGVLRVVGADSWEQLPGKVVRIDHDTGRVYRIGNVIRDEWFDPEAAFRA